MRIVIPIILTIYAGRAIAQVPDTAFIQLARKGSINHYQNATYGQSFLYNGSEYKSSPMKDDQHPFFVFDDWIEGTVDYRGYHFENVAMMYDLLNDALVAEIDFSAQPIVLVKEHVTNFTLGGYQFRRFEQGDHNGSLPASGYYNVIYDGPTQVIARHLKIQDNRIETRRVIIEYEEMVRYYVLKYGRFFPVRSKRGMLKILSDQKQPLREYIRKNRIIYSADRAGFLRKVAEHYDTLAQPEQK